MHVYFSNLRLLTENALRMATAIRKGGSSNPVDRGSVAYGDFGDRGCTQGVCARKHKLPKIVQYYRCYSGAELGLPTFFCRLDDIAQQILSIYVVCVTYPPVI